MAPCFSSLRPAALGDWLILLWLGILALCNGIALGFQLSPLFVSFVCGVTVANLATAMAQTFVQRGKSLVASLTMGLAFGTGGLSGPAIRPVAVRMAWQAARAVKIPVIGIGAGPATDGQVLVLYDLLGITPGKRPRFSHNFLEDADDIPQALRAFVDAVRTGEFPRPEHTFS